MNGRALNEKAVEISPSSHRVLDRAQDIVSLDVKLSLLGN